ncbi:MAG: hypothetical protein F4Y49_15010 [Dehalococcoidia bacterium]|nr:hypothetical protein [Dehalococcoidia bacterium]
MMRNPSSSSFTIYYEHLVNEIQTDCSISSMNDRSSDWSSFRAVWDTGATNSVISNRAVDRCELIPTGLTEVFQVNGPPFVANTYLVRIMLPNDLEFHNILVTSSDLEEDDADVLIGMDIISQGDFAVTHPNEQTQFSFRIPSEADIDFEADIAG